MTYRVRLTRQAQDDLQRLFDFIIERELASHEGALEIAARELTAIRAGFETLRAMPFTCRKEILNEQEVVIAAVRHQREDDYY